MDLLSIFVLAAEGAEHTEHDATSFYITGGLLAVFAIVVGVVGITQKNLGEGPNRAIMVVGSVLVAATLIASVASS
jgi:hypothetical protein